MDLVPGGAKVYMYRILDCELFVLPNGFEITLTEQKVVDTPFYTQRRSKLEKGPDGTRSCFLGLQFNKMSVPSYDSPVYQKLNDQDPSQRTTKTKIKLCTFLRLFLLLCFS
jgi:hypothetical protein